MKPRGLLIANPNATSTSPRMRDIITGALSHELDLEVVTTTHRGHAAELAAATTDIALLVTLGGDGTINEVVNGLLESGREELPMLAAIPGGSANVMARALGFPNDPIEATGMILESLRTDSSHTIGLGNARYVEDGTGVARSHWFTINAGLGLDAKVISAMEAQRAEGHAASPTRYLRTAVREYFADHERTAPALTLELPGEEPIEGIAMIIVQNTSPWTFIGPMPVNPCPRASFETGLDVFAPHSLGLTSTARYGLRMLRGSRAPGVAGQLTALHDVTAFTVIAERPTSLQVDGDGMGLVSAVSFRSAPKALTILG
ncbi:MAG TPA: diacylglycerol kinase family protein [Candidatus Nanopelagicales bacterium]